MSPMALVWHSRRWRCRQQKCKEWEIRSDRNRAASQAEVMNFGRKISAEYNDRIHF